MNKIISQNIFLLVLLTASCKSRGEMNSTASEDRPKAIPGQQYFPQGPQNLGTVFTEGKEIEISDLRLGVFLNSVGEGLERKDEIILQVLVAIKGREFSSMGLYLLPQKPNADGVYVMEVVDAKGNKKVLLVKGNFTDRGEFVPTSMDFSSPSTKAYVPKFDSKTRSVYLEVQ